MHLAKKFKNLINICYRLVPIVRDRSRSLVLIESNSTSPILTWHQAGLCEYITNHRQHYTPTKGPTSFPDKDLSFGGTLGLVLSPASQSIYNTVNHYCGKGA